MQSNDVNINAFDVKSVNIKFLNQKKKLSLSPYFKMITSRWF